MLLLSIAAARCRMYATCDVVSRHTLLLTTSGLDIYSY